MLMGDNEHDVLMLVAMAVKVQATGCLYFYNHCFSTAEVSPELAQRHLA